MKITDIMLYKKVDPLELYSKYKKNGMPISYNLLRMKISSTNNKFPNLKHFVNNFTEQIVASESLVHNLF